MILLFQLIFCEDISMVLKQLRTFNDKDLNQENYLQHLYVFEEHF